MALGNLAIVPNMLSYRETVPPTNRYEWTNEDDILRQVSEHIQRFIDNEHEIYYELEQWEKSIPNMIEEMRTLNV